MVKGQTQGGGEEDVLGIPHLEDNVDINVFREGDKVNENPFIFVLI